MFSVLFFNLFKYAIKAAQLQKPNENKEKRKNNQNTVKMFQLTRYRLHSCQYGGLLKEFGRKAFTSSAFQRKTA